MKRQRKSSALDGDQFWESVEKGIAEDRARGIIEDPDKIDFKKLASAWKRSGRRTLGKKPRSKPLPAAARRNNRRVIQQVIYHEDKDILLLALTPGRPSVSAGNEFDFLTLYDWDNRDEIVGFEVHDFADLFIPHLYEQGAVPELDVTFDVHGTEVKGTSLRDVLEWAYRRYVRKKVEAAA